MASSCASSKLLFLVIILCLWWTPPLARCDDLNGPAASDFLAVPVAEFVASVESIIDGVGKVASFVSRFNNNVSSDLRVSNAISDCLELLDLSVEELNWTLSAAKDPQGTNLSTGEFGYDFKTWLSGVLTNHDTCIDGFDGVKAADQLKTSVADRLTNITSRVAEALRMVKPGVAVSVHEAAFKPNNSSIPSWLQLKQSKIAQASEATANLVVAQDGSGHFTNINAAVNAAPDRSSEPFVIYVKRGVYKEYVEIGKTKWNIVMIGDGMDATVVTGSRNYDDGQKSFLSATFTVKGRCFMAQDMGFENTAGPEKHQAVAFLSTADLTVLSRCAVMGFQDTLYAHKLRQFYTECFITGTVDFIFGRASAIFQSCHIVARQGSPGQKNTIIAQGRMTKEEPSGFSLQFCNIGTAPEVATGTETYLGRPWKEYSRTVVMESTISGAVAPEGWLPWDVTGFALDTLYYAEYSNNGPGSNVGGRVNWPGYHVINDPAVATQFTVSQMIQGNSWLPATGVKYTGGL